MLDLGRDIEEAFGAKEITRLRPKRPSSETERRMERRLSSIGAGAMLGQIDAIHFDVVEEHALGPAVEGVVERVVAAS